MSVNKVKEDLELIASLTASTAGFLKNNVNGMMVGDGKFIKAEMKPQEVIQKAKNTLISEYTATEQPLQKQPITQPHETQIFTPPNPTVNTQPPLISLPPQPPTIVDSPNQLTFNFDNSPTAQNIYYKLNHLTERVDRLTSTINTLSEHILKKKLVKKEKKN